MKFITWPPLNYAKFNLVGVTFEQEETESFVVYTADEVDTSLEADGFLNRIYRYGIANKIDPKEFSEETVTKSIADSMPPPIRNKFLPVPQPVSTPDYSLHTAPVPGSLFQAAKAEDTYGLAQQSAGQWLATLKRWKVQFPEDAKHRTSSGPIWWWAAHSVAMNYANAAMTPRQFVVYWLQQFPCPKCRRKFESQWLRSNPVPKEWENFSDWLTRSHDFVTSHKDHD